MSNTDDRSSQIGKREAVNKREVTGDTDRRDVSRWWRQKSDWSELRRERR